MFGSRSAAEGLNWNPDPAWDQKRPKIPTMYKTTPCILGPWLGQMMHTLLFYTIWKCFKDKQTPSI